MRTFVFVSFGLDAEDGDDGDDDDDAGGGEGHDKPGLPVERFSFRVAVLLVHFGRGLHLNR